MPQTILTSGPPLQTLTLGVFNGDTAIAGSPFTLTEATNGKSFYTATTGGSFTGVHRCTLRNGSNVIANGWVDLIPDAECVVRGSYPLVTLADSQPRFPLVRSDTAPEWYSTGGTSTAGTSATILTSLSSYCSPAAFLEYVDYRIVADWLVDDEDADRLTESQVLAHSRLAKALMVGSGDVEAACLARSQYTPATLLAMVGAAKHTLEKVVAGMACYMLMARRYPDSSTGKVPLIVQESQRILDQLRVGELVFGTVQNTQAGAGMSTAPLTSTRQTSLVEQARGGYFGSR